MAALPLVGGGLTRRNPLTDRFACSEFDHIEFWCCDASSAWRRFALGLGLQLVAKSDQSTGNAAYASYVCSSNELVFVFTAPYGGVGGGTGCAEPPPHPGYDQAAAHAFAAAHGLAVRAVGLLVEDARAAHAAAVEGGAVSLLPPSALGDGATALAEIALYGDAVLRLVSRPARAAGAPRPLFLPGYAPVAAPGPPRCFGLTRVDHVVGNVPELAPVAAYLAGATGFHEFAEFVALDVGTVDSGLNSVVLASNDERVLLPLNEPTHGTRRRSQIQTYLEQHGGPGVQHIALASHDIFATLRAMAAAAGGDCAGGMEVLRSASREYYDGLEARVGAGVLSAPQLTACRELGVLVDRDDRGVLLQIFTKPVCDRPTFFLEIIQRVGCPLDAAGRPVEEAELRVGADAGARQLPGCGGFGKGNFSELFRSIEAHEAALPGLK